MVPANFTDMTIRKVLFLDITNYIQSENLGLRQEILSMLTGDLIRLIVSIELCFLLEAIRAEPTILWFGYFTPIPFIIVGGCKFRSAGGTGWL